LALLLLRVWFGLLIAFGHGWGKLTTFSERADSFADPLGVGSPVSLGLTIFAEFFCSLALALGLISRAVVIPLIITMAIAALVIHSDDPFARKELALLYLGAFLTIFITGPGKYSIDGALAGRQSS
jgi:putative oxidoreductase